MLTRDVELSDDNPKEFLLKDHVKFLQNYVKNKESSYEQMMVEYLKMSGIYWTITALQLVDNDFDDGLFLEFFL